MMIANLFSVCPELGEFTSFAQGRIHINLPKFGQVPKRSMTVSTENEPPPNPPNRATQNYWYKSKLDQHFKLRLYREIPRNLSCLIQNSFIFTQSIPETVWNITHGLGKFASVTVVSDSNQVMIGNTEYINANQVQLTFSAAFSGKAYFN